jgi:hypothetical protein
VERDPLQNETKHIFGTGASRVKPKLTVIKAALQAGR